MKNRILLFAQALLAIILMSCQPSINVPTESPDNKKLNSLLTLEIGQNLIHTQDFILEPSNIDSVSSSSVHVTLMLNDDKSILEVKPSADVEAFVDIQLWVDGVPYSVPCRRSDKREFVFTYDAKGKTYQNIRIAGQMNDWTPTATPALQRNDAGLYEVKLQLSPGTYLYQMNLDGEQEHDPNNPDKVDNGFGKYNSILRIPGVADSLPTLMTDCDKNRKITLKINNKVTGVFVYWQNHRLPDSFIRIEEDRIVFDVPAEALLRTRSYLRVWAMNDYGVSNDVLVPLHEGKVLKDSRRLTRHDHHAQIIYFMLVDRFKNGNPDNDAPLNLPDVNPKADFHGGDLAGLQMKISDGYFSNLGVNTLWVSPLSQNPEGAYGYYAPAKTRFSGYHGYWPVSSSKVDHRFGSNDELKKLVGVAHQNQMNILLDYVANHVHELHPLVQRNPDFATPLYLPDGTMNVEKWDEQRLTTWFDTFLPTLDFSQPELVELMTDSALFWLKEFNFDGFRHDACKHIDEAFWRTLTLKIRKSFPDKHHYQIGETYGSPKLIASYLTSGMLDGQFDFNVFDIANTAFAGVSGDLTRVNSVLQSSLYTYGNHNLMGYISGNHDKPRFMAYASGDLRFGEDTKAAGWLREIGITDSTAYDKLFLFHAFNMTIPGVPVIFYGDEIGITGGDDPDCRKMMRFNDWNPREAKLHSRVTALANLRRNHPVLLYGTFVNIQNTPETWVYGRKYFDEEALVIINNSPQAKIIETELPVGFKVSAFKSAFGQKISIKSGKIVAEMQPYSAEVLLPKKIL